MLVYCIVCYLIMFGMSIENYKNKSIPAEVYFIFIFSPIVLPILIGIEIASKINE